MFVFLLSSHDSIGCQDFVPRAQPRSQGHSRAVQFFLSLTTTAAQSRCEIRVKIYIFFSKINNVPALPGPFCCFVSPVLIWAGLNILEFSELPSKETHWSYCMNIVRRIRQLRLRRRPLRARPSAAASFVTHCLNHGVQLRFDCTQSLPVFSK